MTSVFAAYVHYWQLSIRAKIWPQEACKTASLKSLAVLPICDKTGLFEGSIRIGLRLLYSAKT